MRHGVGLWAVNIADHIALGCAVGYGRQRGAVGKSVDALGLEAFERSGRGRAWKRK
ncbi:MAG: hypothetical protein J6U13_07375 [Salinivirgaceae bacterium]|nr:hypothetical protein [Salinivirgaceae bacterium]